MNSGLDFRLYISPAFAFLPFALCAMLFAFGIMHPVFHLYGYRYSGYSEATDPRIVLGGNFQQLIFDAAGYVQGFDKLGNGLLIDNGVGAG